MPVAEILSEHGHEPAKRTGTTSSYHCPLVGHEDRDPSFTVTGDRWRCWSACDRGGDVIDLVVELDGGPKAGVIERLARRIGLERPERAPRPRTTAPAHLHRVLARFIDQRGWAPEVEEALGLTVVLDAYGSPRIRFPFTPDGRWWQDRATSENAKLRWLSPKGTTPYPYQAHRVLTLGQATGGCFITEGISARGEFFVVVARCGRGRHSGQWAVQARMGTSVRWAERLRRGRQRPVGRQDARDRWPVTWRGSPLASTTCRCRSVTRTWTSGRRAPGTASLRSCTPSPTCWTPPLRWG